MVEIVMSPEGRVAGRFIGQTFRTLAAEAMRQGHRVAIARLKATDDLTLRDIAEISYMLHQVPEFSFKIFEIEEKA